MNMKSIPKNGFGFAILFTAASMAGCKKNSIDPPVPAPWKEIQLRFNAALGTILTDKDGRTLYFFSNDAKGQNSCTGGCEAFWPVFNTDNLTSEKLGAGLDPADFSSITTTSGKKQTTYKGWPLYYFAPSGGTQELPGETVGEGVNGLWFVAKPDYTIMFVNNQLVGIDGNNYIRDDATGAAGTYTTGTGKTMYFTDGLGRTLYTFRNDSASNNNFTKSDFSNNAAWPLYETDKIVVPSPLDTSLFGSIDVFGKKQLTFKGWPLYYYGQDIARGDNKGVSIGLSQTTHIPGWPVPFPDMRTAPN